ncbi:MAG: hypothetical protein D6765_11305, partial [Bacteroidetes bacterium]
MSTRPRFFLLLAAFCLALPLLVGNHPPAPAPEGSPKTLSFESHQFQRMCRSLLRALWMAPKSDGHRRRLIGWGARFGGGGFEEWLPPTTYNSSDVPKTIPSSGTPTITSTLNVPDGGIINDINVVGLQITHTWVGDLEISLTSPQGTTIILVDQVCNNTRYQNMDLDFDDSGSAHNNIPCPPT